MPETRRRQTRYNHFVKVGEIPHLIEEGQNCFGAYVPDVPGCVAVGETREETIELLNEAIAFHLEGIRAEGTTIPPPVTPGEVLDIAA